MRFESNLTDQAVLAELGERLTRARLDRNVTQAQLARSAGVSERTLARIEAGESSQAANLVRVLRALGRIESLEAMLPPALPSPIALVDRRGRERRRASGAPATAKPAAWRWADEG
jgi:transcriptional regulator with XRE-family HTH domain